MKAVKKLIMVFTSAFLCAGAFAKNTLDDALNLAASDIVDKCSTRSIIVIDDFKSPSSRMTSYIREQLGDFIFAQDGLVQIVTRDKMEQRLTEKERRLQNSGAMDENTILSVAKRLGAQFIVFGSFEELNSNYLLRVRMLSVATDAYLFRETYEFAHSAKTEQLLGRAAVYKKASVGLTLEVNKNSLDFIAPAAGISFDYALARKLAVGAKVIASYDIYEKNNSVFTMEPLGFARWYLVSPSGESATGLFVQGEGGLSLFFVNSELKTSFNAGGSVGFRQAFGNFYIEPELRIGYPYIFGFGVTAGFRF